ncbi:MAG TPA: efflux RND transporter periplasmic adaptor subunit [Patescibacteria group bacterium]|nr:efflux RND transporter periplasmic adaptor subunit [Patescibacteria group bacterium]
MNRNTKRIIYAAIGLVILLLLILPKLGSDEKKPAATGPAPGARGVSGPLRVDAILMQPERLENKINTTGTIMPNEQVELKSEVSGRITKIYFSEGMSVGQGALLVKIDDSELRAQLLKATTRKKLLAENEARQKKLLEMEALSQEEYEQSLGEVQSVNADIELLKAQIAKTEIRAPFGGRIGLKDISVGSVITSATPIVTIMDITPLKIDFSVPERYAQMLPRGTPIYFKVQGTGTDLLQGSVYAVEPSINPSTRTMNARALYPNADGRVLPGAFADVQVVLSDINNALMIPTEALVPDIEGQKVFLFKSGKAIPKIVQTGLRTPEKVQITGGIEAGDTVITTGLLQIKPNAPVRLAAVKRS